MLEDSAKVHGRERGFYRVTSFELHTGHASPEIILCFSFSLCLIILLLNSWSYEKILHVTIVADNASTDAVILVISKNLDN